MASGSGADATRPGHSIRGLPTSDAGLTRLSRPVPRVIERWRDVSPTLQGRLSWLVVCAMLPLVALVLGIVMVDYRAGRERAAQEVQSAARGIALAVEGELRTTIASLEALALSPSLAHRDFESFRNQAVVLVHQHFSGADIALFNPDGWGLMNTRLPISTPLARTPNTEALDRSIATGAPTVSDTFVSPLQRAPIARVFVPVRDEGGHIWAVLSMAPSLESFAELVRQQRPRGDWVISVLDRHGVMVARTVSPERFVGRSASTTLLHAMAGRQAGVVEEISSEGIPLLTGWSSPGPSGWSTAVGVPDSHVFAPHLQAFGISLAASALATVAALSLARSVSERIAHPVAALVDLAERARTGEAASATRFGLHEVDAVAAALAAALRERADAEARLRDLQTRDRAELERLVDERSRALQATQSQLLQAQRMEAVGQLTAGVAHDFNNMLQVQMGGLEMVLDLVRGDAEATRFTEMAIAASEHGAKLTHALLAFSRKQVLKPEAVNLSVLLERLRGLLKRTLDPRINLQLDIPADIVGPLADAAQLEAALLNLCLNGRDAMGEAGGLLLLQARAGVDAPGAPDGIDRLHAVVLSVSDAGSGMDPATLARVCEPFFTTKGAGRGSGLGLSMVQGFVRQSGGELRIDSAPGEGTRVELWLPEAASRSKSTAAIEAARAQEAAPSRAVAGGQVLLVEDEPNLRELIGTALVQAGFDVTVLSSGVAALALLRDGTHVQALVTDYAMPDMTGGELVREARRLRPCLPALIITGYADHDRLAQVPKGGRDTAQTDPRRTTGPPCRRPDRRRCHGADAGAGRLMRHSRRPDGRAAAGTML